MMIARADLDNCLKNCLNDDFSSPLSLLAACATATLLGACGGADTPSTPAGESRLLAGAVASQTVPNSVPASAAYQKVAQQLYIAYFGRPADPDGLQNFARALRDAGVVAGVQELNLGYASSGALQQLVESFSASAESAVLYSGDNTAFVTAIYRNLLNRAPDQAGLAFWAGQIDSGGLRRGNAALAIMAGALLNPSAQGQLDGALINRKTAVAGTFSEQIAAAAYRGNLAAAFARAMLVELGAQIDALAFQPTIKRYVDTVSALSGGAFAGAYDGSYTGGTGGSFRLSIDRDGNVGLDSALAAASSSVTIGGSVATDGTLSFTVTAKDGVTLAGKADPVAATLAGTWKNSSGGGSFAARRGPATVPIN